MSDGWDKKYAPEELRLERELFKEQTVLDDCQCDMKFKKSEPVKKRVNVLSNYQFTLDKLNKECDRGLVQVKDLRQTGDYIKLLRRYAHAEFPTFRSCPHATSH